MDNIKILKVQGKFHWGYWVRGIEVSKLQYSLRVPPPTTLIGAISLPLLKTLGDPGETIRGIYSPVINILHIIKWATFSLDGYGNYIEDVNTYILLHFQNLIKDRETGIERRYLMKYRIGAVKTGRIYAPGSKFTILYFIDEDNIVKSIGKGWEDVLIAASYEICRVGSRESIVSILDADVLDAEKSEEKQAKTKYYFPSKLAVNLEGMFFMEKFWEGGYGKKDLGKPIEYIIPGSVDPIYSKEVLVKIRDGNIYIVDGEEVVSPV